MYLKDIVDRKYVRNRREDVRRSGINVEVVETRVSASVVIRIRYKRAYTQRERPWNLAQYGTHP